MTISMLVYCRFKNIICNEPDGPVYSYYCVLSKGDVRTGDNDYVLSVYDVIIYDESFGLTGLVTPVVISCMRDNSCAV